jgi:hypothetical protein
LVLKSKGYLIISQKKGTNFDREYGAAFLEKSGKIKARTFIRAFIKNT